LAGPPAGLAAEDDLKRLTLPRVPALVDEEAHRDTGLARPDIPRERPQRGDVQTVEPDIAIDAFADMPGEDALAIAFSGRLGKGARARDRAFAHIEPVPGESPAQRPAHGHLPG